MATLFEQFRDRMKARLKNPANRIEGGFSMDNIQAVSQELARLKSTEIDPIPDRYFIDTAQGPYLDRKAAEFFEERKKAAPSSGTVVFTGHPGTSKPEGVTVSSNLYSFRTEAFEIGMEGTVSVTAVCETGGVLTNVPAGAVKNILTSPGGLQSVTNPQPFGGGTDKETDGAFRERLLEKIQKPIASGNPNHYEYWARQTAGVWRAVCFPTWAGPGTVKVTILGDNATVPDDVVIQRAAEYIQEQRPIGAQVTVAKAQPLPIHVVAEVLLQEGYTLDEARVNIVRRMAGFFSGAAFDKKTRKLSYLRVGDLIFDSEGVADIMSYTLEGAAHAVIIGEEQFCTVGEVVLNGV